MHVSSPILAAKSPFFLKLFSNGMKESEERHATLYIDSTEEVALMDLLKFMYSNKLSSSTISSLLDVLMLADKFQVPSCMRYCAHLISNLPMTCESASRILDLPSSVLMADGVQHLALADAAEKYLLYRDFTKFEEKLLELPLAEVEVVLSSNDLQVTSEDDLYDFVLKWTRKHCPVIEERREILTTRLASLIHFKYMTCEKLKEILSCNDFDPDFASKVVFEALFFKAQSNHLKAIPRFFKRGYKGQPVKVLDFELPRPHCVVYLDLKKEKFDNFLPSHQVCSEFFYLGGKLFYLFAKRLIKDHYGLPCDLGLFLCMHEKESGSCSVSFKFSAISKPTEKFGECHEYTCTFTGGKGYGCTKVLAVSWSRFIAQDSNYFINGVLYLKAELTMKP